MQANRGILVGFVICMVLNSANGIPQKVCSHWCKTPQQKVYCCDTNPLLSQHDGHCPPIIKTFCPEKAAFAPGYEPPRRCKEDQNCRRTEKCCHDSCLTGTFCKPAIK